MNGEDDGYYGGYDDGCQDEAATARSNNSDIAYGILNEENRNLDTIRYGMFYGR